MTRSTSLILKSVVSLLVVPASVVFLYQNCSQARFSAQSPNSLTVVTPLGGGSCIQNVSVAPQMSFIPSSFAVGESFSVIIANRASYSSIAIDFGDGNPVLIVNPQGTSPINYVYKQQGSFVITVNSTDLACNQNLSSTQTVAVGTCIPMAATLQTTILPPISVPAPVAPFLISTSVTNSSSFTNVSWTVSGGSAPRESSSSATTFSLPAGTFTAIAEGTDSCGGSRSSSGAVICVVAAGNPIFTVTPTQISPGTTAEFNFALAGSYSAISVNFGDGTNGIVPTSGATAGLISHTYSTAGNFSVTATAMDSCGGNRTQTKPVTVSAPSCTPTQADGCLGIQYCTGRTTCAPQGTCTSVCNLCSYQGTAIAAAQTCSGTQTCTSGGTSCSPTSTCANVCGQCGYTGVPVPPVTTCENNQVCTTGGTDCAPTKTCIIVSGLCSGSGGGGTTTTTLPSTTTTSTTMTLPSTSTTTTLPSTTTTSTTLTTTTLPSTTTTLPPTTTTTLPPTTTTTLPPTTTTTLPPTTTTTTLSSTTSTTLAAAGPLSCLLAGYGNQQGGGCIGPGYVSCGICPAGAKCINTTWTCYPTNGGSYNGGTAQLCPSGCHN